MIPGADWMWQVGGWLGIVAGGLVVALALWRDWLRGGAKQRRCRRCFYDMGGIEPRRCPECGREHASEKHLHFARRRWWWAAPALLVLLLGVGAIKVPGVRARGWIRVVPTTLLILVWDGVRPPTARTVALGLGAPAPPPMWPRSDAWTELQELAPGELASRCSQGTVWNWQRDWAVRKCLRNSAIRLPRAVWPEGMPITLVTDWNQSWLWAAMGERPLRLVVTPRFPGARPFTQELGGFGSMWRSADTPAERDCWWKEIGVPPAGARRIDLDVRVVERVRTKPGTPEPDALAVLWQGSITHALERHGGLHDHLTAGDDPEFSSTAAEIDFTLTLERSDGQTRVSGWLTGIPVRCAVRTPVMFEFRRDGSVMARVRPPGIQSADRGGWQWRRVMVEGDAEALWGASSEKERWSVRLRADPVRSFAVPERSTYWSGEVTLPFSAVVLGERGHEQ